MKLRLHFVLLSLIIIAPSVFAATLTFSTSAPASTPDVIANFFGANFDADNVGGSGVNANGGANNGTANDATTYVAATRPVQGQTFTTGANAGGYTLTSITVRAAGYTNNIASGTNTTTYDLNDASTFNVRVGRISGTTFVPITIEYAASGGTGNPGQGSSANGAGTYLTFTFKAPIVLQPNTVYAFDLGTTSDYFEILGIRDAASGGNPYAGGTAYTSGASGLGAGTITTQTGERVFQVNLTAYSPPVAEVFVHPGLLNNEADFERMRTKVAMGVQPWASGYTALTSDWTGHAAGWVPHPTAVITRDANGGNFPTFANDIAVAYGSALRWKVSGDTAYADNAINILNSYVPVLTGVGGDPNVDLIEINAYQFANAAEIMRSYSGWAPTDFAAFQTMIKNVFYPMASDFLSRHDGQGYSYMWANWDLQNLCAIYAIGVLCDDPSLTTEATNYFYNGLGEGCIDRTVYFLHPGYLGQTQEAGRDQGHNTLEIALLGPLCEMAWHQGVDLYGYENNRVLAGAEYIAKYNLFNDVPFVLYATDSGYPSYAHNSVISSYQRGAARSGWEMIYNHYVNRKGLAAPWSAAFATQLRPTNYTGQDQPGFDTLTASLDPITAGANPSGLTATVTAQQPVLSWWGSAYAVSYNVKRATTSGGAYISLATGLTANTYTDTSTVAGTTYYYVVTASLASSGETGASNEAQAIVGTSLNTWLKFDETGGTTAADSTADGWTGTLINSPTWTTGKTGNAVNLASASKQYVSLPGGVVSDLSDFTISTWVYLNSTSNWARICDFGTGTERYMILVPQSGSGTVRFAITGCGGNGEQQVNGTAALRTGQWVHVAATISGSTGCLYVNGLAVGKNVAMAFTPFRLGATTNNWIGRSQFSSDPYLNGKVDEFRVYRGALTPGAVYTLATGLAPASPPAAPASLMATASPGNQIVLSWPAAARATSYTVYRATAAGGSYTPVTGFVTGTSYTDTGLTAGTTYYYIVAGADTGGDGAVSPQASATALPPIPSAATALIAASASSSSVRLTWTAASNAVSYNVKRSLAGGSSYTVLATGVAATSYTDTGLTNGTTYYYVVSAVNAAGEGTNSNEVSAAPSDLLLQLKFDETSGTTAADSSGNGWNATLVNGPTWTTGNLGNAVTLTSASSQYLTLPIGVVNGPTSLTIMAWVNFGTVATWQRVFDFGTGTTNYMFLTSQYSATSGSSNKLRFAIRTTSVGEQVINSSTATPTGWNHVAVVLSGATGRLYLNGTQVGTNTAMTLTPVSLGSTTLNYLGKSQFADPYLSGTMDDFRIYSRALTATEIAAFPASLAAPQNIAATAGPLQATLSWSTVANATSYNVKRSPVSGGPYTTLAAGIASPAYVNTGLPIGTPYCYVVSAVNISGESAASNEVGAVPLSPVISLAEQGAPTINLAGIVEGGATLTMKSSVIGHTYQLQFTSDLTSGSWVNIGGPQSGTGYDILFVAPVDPSLPSGFYRIQIQR